VFPADLVVQTAEDEGRIIKIIEFAVTFQVGAVKFHMVMDMGFVYMGGDKKLVFSLREFHGQLIAQFVGFLRRNFTRLEGLDDTVGDDVPLLRLAPPGGGFVEQLAHFKFFSGGFRAAHIGRHQFPVFGLFFFLVVIQTVMERLPAGFAPHAFTREQVGNRHADPPFL
jgi:hypothetical protein